MRLTTLSCYRLRELMYLGVHDESPATSGEIAGACSV
jgi:hypothetical protein